MAKLQITEADVTIGTTNWVYPTEAGATSAVGKIALGSSDIITFSDPVNGVATWDATAQAVGDSYTATVTIKYL